MKHPLIAALGALLFCCAASEGLHTADDSVLTAIGPGSEQFKGFMDNTEVFRAMVNGLGLGQDRPAKISGAAKKP